MDTICGVGRGCVVPRMLDCCCEKHKEPYVYSVRPYFSALPLFCFAAAFFLTFAQWYLGVQCPGPCWRVSKFLMCLATTKSPKRGRWANFVYASAREKVHGFFWAEVCRSRVICHSLSPLISTQHTHENIIWVAAEEGKPGAAQPEMPASAGQDTIERLDKLRHSSGPLSVAQIRLNLQKTMQADAAVFRTQVCAVTLPLQIVVSMHQEAGCTAQPCAL